MCSWAAPGHSVLPQGSADALSHPAITHKFPHFQPYLVSPGLSYCSCKSTFLVLPSVSDHLSGVLAKSNTNCQSLYQISPDGQFLDGPPFLFCQDLSVIQDWGLQRPLTWRLNPRALFSRQEAPLIKYSAEKVVVLIWQLSYKVLISDSMIVLGCQKNDECFGSHESLIATEHRHLFPCWHFLIYLYPQMKGQI